MLVSPSAALDMAAAPRIRSTLAVAVLGVVTLLCAAEAEETHVKLLTRVNNELIPKLFKHFPGSKEENLVFSPIGLVQNLAVISELSNNTNVKKEILDILKLDKFSDLDQLRTEFEAVLKKFELESREGENSTDATGLFNYLHTSPGHAVGNGLNERLSRSYRTNISEDTSLESGLFSASSDTGVLSHWREREALAVFTLLQHSAAAPFMLNNGTEHRAPLVPHVGLLEAREHPHFSLVKLPLQATSTKLVLVLPKNAEEFARLVDAMPNVAALMDEVPGTEHPREEIELWIPQMLAISSLELKPVLQKLGAKELFTADFRGVTNNSSPLQLSSISQKSFFSTSFTSIKSITESGAQFAEVLDGQRRRRRRGADGEPRSLMFNKPFIFLIERSDMGLVLTAGCVNDPTQFPTQI